MAHSPCRDTIPVTGDHSLLNVVYKSKVNKDDPNDCHPCALNKLLALLTGLT